MTVTQYIGARYVPLFADPADWDNTRTYEPLTIVMHDGNSFTSKQFVPKGIDIDNDEFWAETGNYNAQVEAYRQETLQIRNMYNGIEEFKELFEKAFAYMPENYGAVADGITDDSAAIQAAIDAACADDLNNKVFFSQEKYLIKTTLNIPSRVLLYGDAVQEFTPCIYADFEGTMFNCMSAGVCFSNLCFRPTTDYQNLVDCVRIIPGGNDIDCWLRFCKFFYMHTAFESWGRSVVAENNNFSNSTYSMLFHNIEGESDSTRSYVITGNRFHSWGRGIEENNGNGIVFDFTESHTINEVFISNNYIDRSLSTGAFITGSWVTGFITGNQYNLNSMSFIRMNGSTHSPHASQLLIISENEISMRSSQDVKDAIVMESCVNTVINDNYFTNIVNYPLVLKNCTRVNFVNNLVNVSSDPATEALVYLENTNRCCINYNSMIQATSDARYLKYIATGVNQTTSSNRLKGNQVMAEKTANIPFSCNYNTQDASKEFTLETSVTTGNSTPFYQYQPNCILIRLPGTRLVPFYRVGGDGKYVASPVYDSLTLAFTGQINIANNELTNTHIFSFNPTTMAIVTDNIAISGYVIEDWI